MNKERFLIMMAGLVVIFIMLTINILQFGGRDMIVAVNNLSMLGFGIFTMAQVLGYWRSLQSREEANRVWLLFGLGTGFYMLGQLTWMAYNALGVEVPYPSLGDVFWVLAYPLLFISIVNKILLIGVKPTKNQIMASALYGAIFFLLIGGFIILPMLKYTESARWVETLLNFFYPIMDFLLLVAISFLVTILWRGKLSLSWNILAVGFFFLALADVFFIYATWNELYYAEGASVNLLTRSIDVAYVLSIALFALGTYLYQWAATIQPETIEFEFTQTIREEQSKPQPRQFTTEMQTVLNKVFFMVDGDHNVYFVSQYYRELCQLLGSTVHVIGSPLHEVLGVEKIIITNILSNIQSGLTTSVPLEIVIGATYIPTVLRVASARNGCDVFLQYQHSGKPLLAEEQKTIDAILVEETLRSVQGLENSSMDMRGATAFFLIEVQEMYFFMVRMGGYRIAQILIERFNQLAADQNTGVRITDGRVVLTDSLDTKSMSNLLRLTLRTVQELTSVESTSIVVKQLNEKIPEGIIRSAQNVGLAL